MEKDSSTNISIFKHLNIRGENGQSLMEILIALGIFAISLAAGFQLFFGGQSLSIDSQNASLAIDYAREGAEAVRSIRDRNWAELADGMHGLVFQNNEWMFGSSSTSDSKDIFTRTVSILTSSENVKIATTTITWQADQFRTQTIELVEQLTNWESPSQGGCKLGPLSGNWANPQVLGSGDLGPGNEGTDVVVKLPYAYVSGVASASSKPDIFVFDVSNPSSPLLVATKDIGSKGINALFLKGNYLYAASSNDSKELIIFNISNPTSISEAGSLNLNGTAGGLSVAVFGNTAALGRRSSSENELYFIDVSSPSSPSLISSIELGGNVNDLTATSDKLFVVMENSSQEVGIFDVVNPSNPTLITYYNISNAGDPLSIGFQAPANILVGDEDDNFFILGATSTSQIYARSSFNIPGDGDIYDMVCVEGNLAFLATKESNKEFYILNISNPDQPYEYASLNFPQQGTGIDFADNKVFMSVRSNDALRIITAQ